MKALILTSTYPMSSSDSQPVFVQRLSEQLSNYHNIAVLTPSINGRASTEKVSDNLVVMRYRYFFSEYERLAGGDGVMANIKRNKWLLLLVPFLFISLMLHCRRFVKQEDIDVIHAHWIIPQGLAAVLARQLFKLPVKVVVTSHGGDLFSLRGRFFSAVKRWVLSKADHVTVVSQAMKVVCIDELKIPAEKISVRSMGVDLQNRFVPAHVNSMPLRMVFVGRLVEKKGVDVLLSAMLKVRENHPDVRLDIIGGGGKLDNYKATALSLGLQDTVIFHGAKSNELVPAFLQEAAIAVLPFKVGKDGDQEGLGLTAVEAMGCRCAVVVSSLPALRDVVQDGVTGCYCRPGDADNLAEKIGRLIEDKELREKLGRQGREFVIDRFDWEKVGLEYSRILSAAVKTL